MKFIALCSILFVATTTRIQITEAACTAEYAVQKFDMIQEGYDRQTQEATVTASRYNLISVEVKLPDGKSPYVKKSDCAAGTTPTQVSDMFAITCTSSSTSNTITGCTVQQACNQCMPAQETYCCPPNTYGGKITFSDGVEKDGCASFQNTQVTLRAASTDTLVKYSDFYKNAYNTGQAPGQPGFTAEITGCAKETTSCGSSGSSGPSMYNAMPMAPYKNDRLSNYFKYQNSGGNQHPSCNIHNMESNQAYNPFSSAKTVATASGCKLMVTLDDEAKAEELVSVDGVSLDCLTDLKIPYLKLALNIIPALDSVTKAAPAGEEEIRIETRDENGNVQTRTTKLTYAKYNVLLQKVTNMAENSNGRLPTCWTPGDDTNTWDCTSSAATCTRKTGYTRAINDAKATAYANLRDDIVSFLSFETLENLQTGAFQELTKNVWNGGKCNIKMSNLFDKDGNEVCTTAIETNFVKPTCSYTAMSETTKGLKDTLKKMSDGKMKSDTFSLAKYTSTDAWFACSNLVSKMQDTVIKSKTRTTSSCVLQMPNFCGETSLSFCKKNPTNAWCTNPCCNFELSRTMCCAASTVTFDATAYKVNAYEVASRCATDESLNNAQVGTFVASAVTSAQNFMEASTKPEICFEDQEQLNKNFAKLGKMPDCCVKSVLNTYENSGKSIQYCNKDSDCYSGKCSNTNVDLNDIKQGTKDCFPDYEGKRKICSVVDDAAGGEPLAKCLVDFTTNYNNFPKALALLKKVFANNDQDANTATIGQGIFTLVGQDSCVGGSSSYKYDPDNWCQSYNYTSQKCEEVCKGIACKPLCEAEKACNVDGWNCKDITCCDSSKTVCAEKSSWGNGYWEDSSRSTKSSCEGGTCNLRPWDNSITPQECLALPGQCEDYNCLGCTADYGNPNRVEQVCFIPSISESECDNRYTSFNSYYRDNGYVSKEYKDGCYLKTKHSWPSMSETNNNYYCNVTAGETYVRECSSLSIDTCPSTLGWAASNSVEQNISNVMGCKPTGNSRCKTQSECENSGYCSGGIRSDYYIQGKSVYKSHVCVIPRDDGDWNCQNVKTCTPTSNGHNWCHDELAGHLNSNMCYSARMNQSYCGTRGGTWTSTLQSKASCETAGRCQINGRHSELTSQQECAKCGGDLEPENKWRPGKWIQAQYLTGSQHTNKYWLNKSLTQENTWSKKLYPWRFSNYVSRVLDILKEEAAGTFSACLFGRQAHALETISAICGTGENVDPSVIGDIVSKCVETAKVTTFKGVPETAGNAKESNLQLNSNTLPSTANEAILSLCEETYIPESNSARRRRRRQRSLGQMFLKFRGLKEEKEMDLGKSECYTVVKNSKGKLVGQLIGGCLNIDLAVSMANPAKLCLKLNDNIERNAKFTTFDFAIRTKDTTTKKFVYTAMQTTAYISSDLLCANITKNNAYCPIKTVANMESVTEDQGSDDCIALDNIINEVQNEKKKQKCKLGDSKSCEWFEPGSTSFVLATGAIVVIVLAGIVFLTSTYCCHKHRHLIKKHVTKAFFDSVDADGNGVLDAGEIQIMLKREFGAKLSIGQVTTLMLKFGQKKEMDFEAYKKFIEYLKQIDEDDHDHDMKAALQTAAWKRKSVTELTPTKNPLYKQGTI
jgi:hypothetical protein